MHRIMHWLPAILAALQTAGWAADIVLVENGRAQAVVVTADEPSRVTAYAADELVTHVRQATGVGLPLAAESRIPKGYACRVLLGPTREAADRGLTTDELANDAFILRTIGSELFILGKEHQDAAPLSPRHGYGGTMFGVYEVLERELGVRWLWPGKLGTYVPRADTVTIRAVDETIAPRLLWREISYNNHVRLSAFGYGEDKKPGWPVYPEHQRQLAFRTQEGATQYVKDVETFMRRHRLGASQPLKEEADYLRERRIPRYLVYRMPRPNHGFHGWWLRYGKRQPEWFAMREDGTRGPKPGDPYSGQVAAMCVSNPDLHRYIVEGTMIPGKVHAVQWNTTWDGKGVLDLSEADVAFEKLCQCPRCQAWDGPQVDDPPAFALEKYQPRLLSDRYLRFWKTVYDLAAKRYPHLKMTTYIYHNYYPAPRIDVKLSPNVIGEFVLYGAAGYYPMTEAEDRWNRDQWLGWRKTGMSLILRPNYMLVGYVMPEIATRQIVDFFRFAYQNGMVAAYYDSLACAWAAQGPMSYLHYRLLWNPTLDANAIRSEYFSAFGPAARQVEDYFDYWEAYVRTRPPIRELVPEGSDYYVDETVDYVRRPLGAVLAYPASVYPPAEALLEKALAAARKDALPEHAERVRFLQAGLEHAKLSARVHEFLDYQGSTRGTAPTDVQKLRKARRAMKELIEFRRAHQDLYVADYISAANWEASIGNLSALYPESEGLIENEAAFQKRWPEKAVRDPGDAGLRLVESRRLPRDGWRFRKDASRRGDLGGWHLPKATDADWRLIRIERAWASFLGEPYVGAGWYRRLVQVPKLPKGGTAYLHFEAVDESCWVWVNGTYVGRHHIGPTGWDQPFRLEVTHALKLGDNLVAVRAMNTAYAGGIWRPVFLELFEAEPQE